MKQTQASSSGQVFVTLFLFLQSLFPALFTSAAPALKPLVKVPEVCSSLALGRNATGLISSQVHLQSVLTAQVGKQVDVLACIVLFWPGQRCPGHWWKPASRQGSLSTKCGCTLDREMRGSRAGDCHRSWHSSLLAAGTQSTVELWHG